MDVFCSAELEGPTAKGADQRDLLEPNKSLVKIGRRCENAVQVERGPSYTFWGASGPFGHRQHSVISFPAASLLADALMCYGQSIVPAVLRLRVGLPPSSSN